jgi:aspartyl/asparaginyl beta-hydroxylase (cupin superfamily)
LFDLFCSFIESSGNIQPVEQSSTDKIDELNEELLLLKNQYEELEKINKQLVNEKEELNSQLNDRSIFVAQEAPIELTQEVCVIFLLYPIYSFRYLV